MADWVQGTNDNASIRKIAVESVQIDPMGSPKGVPPRIEDDLSEFLELETTEVFSPLEGLESPTMPIPSVSDRPVPGRPQRQPSRASVPSPDPSEVGARLAEALAPAVVYVLNAQRVGEKTHLVARWKTHRAKFIAAHDMERAVAAMAVINALSAQDDEPGLLMVRAAVAGSDHLLWFDERRDQLIACFAEAHRYLG